MSTPLALYVSSSRTVLHPLQGVLVRFRLLGHGFRVNAGHAGEAKTVGTDAHRLAQSLDAQKIEGVGADVPAYLLDGPLGGDQLLAGRDVDAVAARVQKRRRRHVHEIGRAS